MSIQQLAQNGNEVLRAKYCPVGYGMIQLTGDYSCCAVCGRQNGEVCDATAPCDSTLELVCKYENVKSPKQGICRRKCLLYTVSFVRGSNQSHNPVLELISLDSIKARPNNHKLCRLISLTSLTVVCVYLHCS